MKKVIGITNAVIFIAYNGLAMLSCRKSRAELSNNYRLMTKRLTLIEARKKAWSIGGVVARFFQNLFSIECPKCSNNSVHHSHSEYTGRVWIEVYQCRKCREKFV